MSSKSRAVSGLSSGRARYLQQCPVQCSQASDPMVRVLANEPTLADYRKAPTRRSMRPGRKGSDHVENADHRRPLEIPAYRCATPSPDAPPAGPDQRCRVRHPRFALEHSRDSAGVVRSGPVRRFRVAGSRGGLTGGQPMRVRRA